MALTQQEMIAVLHERVMGMAEPPTTEEFNQMVDERVAVLQGDEEWMRKMKFGTEASKKLVGSKYARWGCSVQDIEYLYDLTTSLEGVKRVGGGMYPGPSEELTRAFKDISAAYYLSEEEVREADIKAIDKVFPRVAKMSMQQRKDAFLSGNPEIAAYRAAMDSAETGFGLQLIGAQYVGDLWEGARPMSRVMGLFNTFEMTAPTAYIPVNSTLPEMFYVPEQTTTPATEYATTATGSNRVQTDAKKYIIHQVWSGEMEEDSIIPYIPFLRREQVESLAFYGDSLLLNGDTTTAATGNINSDDEAPAATKHYLGTDGFRHVGLVDATGQGLDVNGVVTLATLKALITKMIDRTNTMDWGHPDDPNDLVFIGDPTTVDEIASIDDVVNWFEINGRPLLTGQQAAALGHPVVSSIAMPLTEADGKVSFDTPANNIKGQLQCLNRRSATIGWRRRVMVETERIPASDQTRMFTSLRMGLGRFSATGAASGIKSMATAYNITLPA